MISIFFRFVQRYQYFLDLFNDFFFFRFVQRFRHQPPAPRGHREQKDGKEFWWLQQNSSSKNKKVL